MTGNPRPSFEETLEKVILSEKCIGCAACVVTCPSKCLEYTNEKPEIISECNACGICSQACPQYCSSRSALEKFVFRRQRASTQEFGIYQRVVVARSTDKNILAVCQDGGVVTTLLTFALKNEIIDGAATSTTDNDKPLCPVPALAITQQQILQSAGTKYSYSANLLAFQKGIEQDRKKLAFVGTPCQVEAIRRIQMIPLKNYVEKLKFTIGLMCSGSFSYEGLVEDYIKGKIGINAGDIRKINIKKRVLITMKSGETKAIPLKKIRPYIRKSCGTCTDFSAELADVSVGGLGLHGWSLVILRTEIGQKLFMKALKSGLLEIKPIEKEKRSLDLLVNLSIKRRMKQKTSRYC